MAHPLEQKIARVRGQARRLVVLYALGWTVAVMVGAVLLFGVVDFLIRFQDHGVRFIGSLALGLTFAWTCYRFGPVAWGRRLSDVALAQRIESRFPVLSDRLASTIQFLKQSESDIEAGSAAMRRAVILQTTTDVEGFDFSQVFERKPTWRALSVGGAVGLIALATALLSPDCTRIALARMARPFGDDAWPKVHHLAFRAAPTRLAAGQPFEVELVQDAEHRVPDEVRIHYRYENGNGAPEEEAEPMKQFNGAVVARKDVVTRPFSYRAEGGDDTSMPWIRLQVLEPPHVESLRLTLYPPQYTGLPSETSEKSIHAVRGTRVELAGTSTKKLRGVTVHLESGEVLVATVSAEGHDFTLAADAAEPLVIDKSGAWWIELEDSEGLIGGRNDRWDIRAVADLPPSVTVEQPSGNIFVTPQGEVPLRIGAKDDLAIHDVALHFNRSDRTDVEDFAVPLWQGPATATVRTEARLLVSGQLGESQLVEHRWSLSELNLKPGAQVTFWATAADYLPQVGKSTVRRLSIITAQELEERLAQRQTVIFGELQRVLKLQQDARAQTKSLEIQLQQVGRLNKQDVDHAQSAELNQRQVKRTLTSPTEGLPAQIADFLSDLANNRVDNPDIERRMAGIVDEIDRLGGEHLTPIERELTSVIKAAQSKLPEDAQKPPTTKSEPDALLNKSLTSAGMNQDQVIDSLEKMLDDLGLWDSYRRFAREIAGLQRDQQEIARATKEIGQKTVGRETKDLDAQQQADLKKLAGQQVELSRKLEKVQQQMAQMSQSLQQTNPLSAATISDGLHHAEQQAISGQMRQASEQLERNRLGQAAQQQAQTLKDLEELSGILSNRREQQLTRLVKQLRESEQELARIRSAQAGLHKRLREASAKGDKEAAKQQLERLSREQKKLEQDAERLARRLERLQAEQAGRSTAGAAGKMSQAGDAGQQGNAQSAEDQAEKAEHDLEEAQQQLAERRKQAEEELAREQLAKLEDGLKSLHERQKKLLQETERLEGLRAAAGRLTRAQLSTVNDLARQQKSLEGETNLLADKLSLTEVISMALEGAAKQMTRASDLLEHRDTGNQTQGAQEAARLRFAQLLTALADNAKREGGDKQDSGGGAGGGGSGSQDDAKQALAQLKLLKILQEDLNGRYRTLSGPDDAPAAEPGQLTDLAAEQGKLAELAQKLSQPVAKHPEDNPESLPDVRQEGRDLDVPPPDESVEPTVKEPS
jgi:hypothetical protein